MKSLFFHRKVLDSPLVLFIAFNVIGWTDIDSSNIHPRYVTCTRRFIFISLYLIFSLRIFLVFWSLANWFSFVFIKMNSYLLSKYQSQIFPKFLLSLFSISVIFLSWYIRHKWSTQQEIIPKSGSLILVFAKYILLQR